MPEKRQLVDRLPGRDFCSYSLAWGQARAATAGRLATHSTALPTRKGEKEHAVANLNMNVKLMYLYSFLKTLSRKANKQDKKAWRPLSDFISVFDKNTKYPISYVCVEYKLFLKLYKSYNYD